MTTTTDSRHSVETGDSNAYTAEILSWRARVEKQLRAEDGWLTLTGLYWLHEGENTLGSDPASDVLLSENAPAHVGIIDFHADTATLRVMTDAAVTIDGEPVTTAVLRDDYDPHGLTRVFVGSVNFYVVKRADQYGIRVRDQQNPARQVFTGREWFPVDPSYRVTATYTPYPQPRELGTETVIGVDVPMQNPGYVTFKLADHDVRLEAFSGSEGQIWFVFRDTSPQIYRAGRFLYASLNDDGTTVLDFNQAYNPPCAFTPYATCPLPPKQNILDFAIEAGEILADHS